LAGFGGSLREKLLRDAKSLKRDGVDCTCAAECVYMRGAARRSGCFEVARDAGGTPATAEII